MLKRKIKKLTKAQAQRIKGTKFLVCKVCEEEEILVGIDTAAVTCGRCVQKLVAPPATKKIVRTGKPRGWHFKVYFEQDGVVYSKGKEIKDAKKIATLRKAHPTVKATKKPKKGSTVVKAVTKRGRKNASTAK